MTNLEIHTDNKLVSNSAAIDLEWSVYTGLYRHEKTSLISASFCTNLGTRIVLHISQFQRYQRPERQLILRILDYLNKFPLTFGWYTTGVAKYDPETGDYIGGKDSDFFILDQRCKLYNITSPVRYSKTRASTFLRDKKHIDLHKVYSKEIIQKGVFGDKYRTLHLHEVSQVLLGVGKYKDSHGENVHLLPVSEQLEYVKRDAELTMMLACYNNSMVLQILEFISMYSGLDYIITCHTGVSKWYTNIYDKMIESDECTLQSSEHKIEKREYVGGNSIEPKKGFYKNEPVDELDVKGMYPTIAINHNISFETVNCRCCKDNPDARIPYEVMYEINQGLKDKGLAIRNEHYWVCKLRKGAFPTKLRSLIHERERYRELLRLEYEKATENQRQQLINYYEARQIALKLLANAGYGCFAKNEFAYSDYRVSEIITGFGRLTHKEMEKIGQEKYGFQTIFGFTDSIFIRHSSKTNEHIASFIQDCKNELGIDIEHKNRFAFTIIFAQKNRYIAWTGKLQDRPILKNLDGMNRRYPKWMKRQIEKIVTHIITNPDVDAIPIINQAFEELDYGRFDPKDMQFTTQLYKHPNQYPEDRNVRVRILGLELGADKGEIVYWYESLANEKGYSIKIKDLSIKKYKEILWNKMEDMLEITGYDIEKIKSDLLYKSESIAMIYR
jgi:DNA polymerase elongation subunit (family B)